MSSPDLVQGSSISEILSHTGELPREVTAELATLVAWTDSRRRLEPLVPRILAQAQHRGAAWASRYPRAARKLAVQWTEGAYRTTRIVGPPTLRTLARVRDLIANPEMKPWHGEVITRMLRAARGRAKQAGIEFSLTAADITIPTRCPVLGIHLTKTTTLSDRDSSPSLDRIDSSGGYTPANVAVISYRANRIKSNASADELRSIAAWMERKQQ